jgi:predicted GIY-YIG superfamily endonuclease
VSPAGPLSQSGPYILYRCFDKDGALLYIGITSNPSQRFSIHELKTPWWSDVASITQEEGFESRSALEAAEIEAINAEYPLFNLRDAKYGFCSTCGSQSPRWFPRTLECRGAVRVVLPNVEPFITCTDPYHWPDDERAKMRHANRDELIARGFLQVALPTSIPLPDSHCTIVIAEDLEAAS